MYKRVRGVQSLRARITGKLPPRAAFSLPAPLSVSSEPSAMARAASAAALRALRLLPVALLLLVLVAASRPAAGAPVASELRCQCLQTVQGIHLKNIASVKLTPPAPHCDQTEVIATLKNGKNVCLNPEAPMVKKIIQKLLNSGTSN